MFEDSRQLTITLSGHVLILHSFRKTGCAKRHFEEQMFLKIPPRHSRKKILFFFGENKQVDAILVARRLVCDSLKHCDIGNPYQINTTIHRMGIIFSFLAKAATSTAVTGYAAHTLLSSLSLSRPIHNLATFFAALGGLVYYMKVWINDYYVDWSYNDNRDLTGRTAVVTGGTINGLGFAIAELLYEQGATVILTVRTKEKGDAAIAKLQGRSKSKSNRASYVLCDFLSESSVRNCVSELQQTTQGQIDFLILNAGTSGRRESKAGKQQQQKLEDDDSEKNRFTAKVWMTNHVGPWIFAQGLMPSLVQTAQQTPGKHPRVVWVSSGAHKRATIHWEDPLLPDRTGGGLASAYGQSKLANIMHAREYQKRIRGLLLSKNDPKVDVKCFAITPGLVWTNFVPKIPLLYPLFWCIMRSPKQGAQVIKMACLDESLEGGEYMSNCYVKESEGIDGCSNDEEQWKRLWELTAKQVQDKEYEKFIETSTVDKKTN